MARQNGRRVVHFDDGFGPVCLMAGSSSSSTENVYLVDCGRCERTPAFRAAWDARPPAEVDQG